MKKLILGLALTAGSLAFAQTTTTTTSTSSAIRFGIKAGMNVASLSDDAGLEDQKSKIGFNAGVFASIPLAESFSIQPEILYSQYGAKIENTDEFTVLGTTTRNVESYSTNLDYITVPVMFQYNFVPNFYVEAGPEFGFLISAKNKGDRNTTVTTGSNVSTSSSSYTEDIDKDNLNTFNFGVGIGAGYYFTDNIGITARYVAGVTDVAKDRPSGSDAVRNNTFQVGLAYKF
ncbi:PorT family protein [Chryseobacterium chendengshani]|uniref:porin family protein n=1 Tax=Chryseobacterium sp. LJ668 TaxID=2864040 RepID=UPI001C694018|nr:porin family protein [Chryseobacterium sp. LJ668]MBW8522677.1 PorT family protein [Chryseobacterium sp. LJ668]QYK16211.1 PorT family protein [Chryseobacterium sp. LJ668]